MIRRDLLTSHRNASKIILFFSSPGKTGIVSTDRRFCGSHQRPPAGAVRRFGPAAACKKPYFCPPGVSVLNKKKEGRCTHIWCS